MKKEMNVDFIFGEEWRFTPEYPNYMVSNYGRVYSYYHQKIIKPFCNTGGYLTLTLTVAKKLKRVKLSRLVAMAFHPAGPASHRHLCPHSHTYPTALWRVPGCSRSSQT